MSKKRRSNSPVSEDTLVNHFSSFVNNASNNLRSVQFVDNEDSDEIDDELFNNDSSDSESEVVDDTDEDPDFDPITNQDITLSSEDEQPSTSVGRPRGRPRVRPNISSAEINNLPNDQVQNLNRPRPRRRTQSANHSNGIYNVQCPIGEDDANAGWNIYSEDNDPGNSTDHMFYEEPGPKYCPPNDSKPIKYFDLFFTHSLLVTFVMQTNLYASQYFQKYTESTVKWKPVTLPEMKAFIAVILNMGLYKRPTIDSFWRTKSKSQSLLWFRQMFSRNRFETLLRFFHVTDNRTIAKPGEQNYDPCARFSYLVEHANRVFRRHYTPHRELSIDESLIGTKSHTAITQYLPNKHHHRWGIKLWMMCDSVTNYCLGFFCYKGKKDVLSDDEKDKSLAYRVVVKLLESGQLLNKGYHLFVDNFFMSVPLAKYLFSKGTYMTGTIRRNRVGIPDRIKEKLEVSQQVYMRQDNLLMLSYREKKSQIKPVLLLSTKCKASTIEKVKSINGVDVKKYRPGLIEKYNMYMGGIDTSDQMLYCYLDERRTKKYWRKVVFNIIARMVLNTYLLYKENNTGKILSRYDYTADIIDDLAEEWLTTRDSNVRPMEGGDAGGNNFGMEQLPGRLEKNCSVCSIISTSAGGPRKRSRYCCKNCNRGVHPLCFGKHRCSV